MADASLQRSGIYEIVHAASGKRYVGSAVCFEKRWRLHRLHLNRGTHHSRHLQSSWTKHGADAFEFRQILLCDVHNLIMYEQIAFDALKPEFNIARVAGSCLGVKHTPETRAKLSASKVGNQHTLGYKHRPETIELLRAKQTGVTSPTKGMKRDPAAVAATAAAHRGMKRSAETRAKIAAKAAGRKCPERSAEYRAKISAAHKGRPKSPEHIAAMHAGRRAKAITEDERRAISEALKRSWNDGKRSRVKSEETKARMSKAFSKLTDEEVREMRRLHAAGTTGRELAKRFGATTSTVSHIVRGQSYRWVADE